MFIWRIADAVLLIGYGIFITWLLTTIISGNNAIHEPNKALLWAEIILTAAMALYGVIRFYQAYRSALK